MKNLLGKSKPNITQPQFPSLMKKFGELSERTRLIEERMKQTRDKLQVLDETFSSKINDLKEATSNFEGMINDIKKEFSETKEILRRVVKELNSTAKLSDVKVLEKYISMVDITRIVTKEDVKEIVEEILKKKK